MDRDNAETPVLIGQTGPLNGQRWPVMQSLVIGRDPGCHVVLTDRQVSRYHARLTPSTGGVMLEDLGSKNGTFHNGTRIYEPALLQDGDEVQIALIQHFVFLSSDATLPLGAAFQPPEHGGRLHLDTRSRRVWIGQKEVLPPLSVPQFRLLQALYEQEDRVVSRQEMIDAIWGDEAYGVSDQALDALVRRLRDRLALIDPENNYILTVRGHGLRIHNPRED